MRPRKQLMLCEKAMCLDFCSKEKENANNYKVYAHKHKIINFN